MTATPIFTDQTFYVPRYEILLGQQSLPPAVLGDVKEISYNDSLETLDSFEFVLHDWDAVRRTPRYSSPYNASGEQQKLPDGSLVPVLDPGAEVELRLGYYGPEDPTTMLKGKIVSVSPDFPAAGTPTLRLRALNPLYSLQKKQETMNFEQKTDSQIAQEIARALDIEIEIPPGQVGNEQPYDFMSFSNQYPIDFLMGRARRIGYDLYMKQEGKDLPKLFFGKAETTAPTYELEWGRSLVSFTPTIKTKGQVTRVVVRGWQPTAKGNKRQIVGTATWADLSLNLPDPKLISAIDSALQEFEEQVVEDPIESQAEADAKALGILTKKVQDLITGKGRTVGLPGIRAGNALEIKGIGARFEGRYVVTETTHKLDATGYMTDFTARLEEKL